MKKTIYTLAVAFLTALFLSSCENFLETEPVDKLVPNTFFQTEKDLELYTNSFYQRMLPGGLEIVQSDEWGDYTSKNQSPAYISGYYSSVDEGAWNWTDLRNINYFLENFDNETIPQEGRDHYEGIARFFRAFFYFEKVKRYGDVPIYQKPLATDDEEQLYKGRDSREDVIDFILADLDFAVSSIRDGKDNSSSMITKQVAQAFLSRVALFEGTYRKYHQELGLSSTASVLLQKAASAALGVMESGQYSLYTTGSPESDYRTLFISENPVQQEVLLAVVYNNALKRWHNITWKFNSATYGNRWGLNKQFVNTYLQLDGSRFTERPGFDTIQFVREMDNRDHRLAQTVRSLGYTRSDGSAAPPNFGYTYTGYHLLKHSLDDKRLDGISEAYNSIPMIRYAEVLLNYAEAKAELGEFDESVWNQTIAPLRQRAGVNSTMPIKADSYLTETYFPEITDTYLLEVRRERGIELCYEGFRYDDLLRWKKGELVEMSWKGIYVPGLNVPMDLDGNGTLDVAFVETVPNEKVSGVIYFVVDGTNSILSEGTSGHIIWRANESRDFSDKKYLHPISNTDLVLNPNLGQNPGWE